MIQTRVGTVDVFASFSGPAAPTVEPETKPVPKRAPTPQRVPKPSTPLRKPSPDERPETAPECDPDRQFPSREIPPSDRPIHSTFPDHSIPSNTPTGSIAESARPQIASPALCTSARISPDRNLQCLFWK